jgi:hypothetical protein
MHLPLVGQHNVQKSLAAIAVAVEMGIDEATIRKGLAGIMVGAGVGVLGGFLVAIESNTITSLLFPKASEKQIARMEMLSNVVATAVAVGGIFLGGKYAYDQYNAAKGA